MKIAELIQQPEGRTIEFKESLPKKSDLNKTIVAFSNDAGGTLILGIKDDPRQIVGIPEDKLVELEEQISSQIHDSCSPTILPDISFQNIDGKYIIIVRIAKGNNPPYHLKSKGEKEGTYIRVGSSNRKATPELLEELYRKRSNISFDSVAVYEKKLDEINLHSFKDQFKQIVGEEVTLTSLRKLNLTYQEHDQLFPTNALILLSDDDLRQKLFPYSKIECARFKGTTPGNFIDQKTIDAPLTLQAEQAYQFLLRHISQGSSYEGVYRKDRWEYPIIALREVIRNAIIHRDYALTGKDIKIAVFDDKIEITSPGNLLPTVDFNQMESGQSDIRNKVLAPIFKKLGIIEQWGNGLKLISNELKEYSEIKFQWTQPGMSFRATFLRTNYEEENDSTYDKSSSRTIVDDYGRLRPIATDYDRLRPITTDYEQLDIDEKKILIYLLDNERITRKIAVGILDYGETKTKEVINGLLNKHLIARKGKGRGTHYILKK